MNSGHRERLRKKYLKGGFNALHDYEMLELLLTFVIPRRDVKPIAKAMLVKFKDMQGVMDASLKDLTDCRGIGENAATMLLLLKDLCTEYLTIKIKKTDVVGSPADVVNFARMCLGAARQETFMILYLNTKNHVLDYDRHEGTVDRAAVYPRNIIKRCLELHASSIILVHNHPSGQTEPSPADINITREIDKAAGAVGITLHDHIVVSSQGYCSFRENRLI
ncbi:DNA repair protein RadC [Lentisphaerota bacterium ZTH]|nr:DNA repair protein RadC [Lentisphaerota bacterium]WET07514.1 DNA repair protein RadC [Lentisphaerota bacterium ZTH]